MRVRVRVRVRVGVRARVRARVGVGGRVRVGAPSSSRRRCVKSTEARATGRAAKLGRQPVLVVPRARRARRPGRRRSGESELITPPHGGQMRRARAPREAMAGDPDELDLEAPLRAVPDRALDPVPEGLHGLADDGCDRADA